MDDLAKYLPQIALLPPSEQKALLTLMQKLDTAKAKQEATQNFLPFIHYMWPSFIDGAHHKKMANLFDEVIAGKKKRVIINMPPRHTKSEFASIHLPAYFLGRAPEKKVMMASHTAELAVGFGRKVRGLIDRKDFQELFPGVRLSADNKAAGRWATNRGGEYFAVGVNGAVAGKGADLFIIDDPHALEVGTPIPTPSGFVAIKDLRVGDEVFGPDGETTKIIAKSDIWHDRELYSVLTDDGQEILCDSKHLWTVRSDTKLSANDATFTSPSWRRRVRGGF